MNKAMISILDVFSPIDSARTSSRRLAKGEAVSIAVGRQLVCVEGQLWLTMAGDPQDYVLTAGQSMDLTAPAVVSGLSSAAFAVA